MFDLLICTLSWDERKDAIMVYAIVYGTGLVYNGVAQGGSHQAINEAQADALDIANSKKDGAFITSIHPVDWTDDDNPITARISFEHYRGVIHGYG